MPHITSSRMSSAPCRLQMSRTAAEISLRRRHAAGGGADHGLGNERGHRVGAEALEFGLQFGRQPRHEIRLGFDVALFVIGKRRRHVAESRRQQWRIGFASPGVAAGGQRPKRIAVIALAARDEVLALRLAALDKILPRQLDAGFDRFRSAADEVGIGETAGLIADADGRPAPPPARTRRSRCGHRQASRPGGTSPRARADVDDRDRKRRRRRNHRESGGHPRQSATCPRRRRPLEAFRAGFDAARGS